MIPWELLDTAPMPGGNDELKLFRRGEDFTIRLQGLDLMTSRVHGSEETLATMVCERVGERANVKVLVGGLGMGFTLAAALQQLKSDAIVEVAELVPAVVEWNQGLLGHLAGHPLDDPRTKVRQMDFAALLKSSNSAYDGIMNDVDNGPDGLLRPSNRWLYSPRGLAATYRALRPGGVLTVWSVGPDVTFTKRLTAAGFEARARRIRDRGGLKGRHHTIWVARRQ
jgi:spermidine synthase